MSTALALTSCEAQSIAVAGGKETKSAVGTGKARDTSEGFKKELEDCEAMVIPAVQPTTTDGSIPNAEAGKQQKPGAVEGSSGVCCVFEGIEVPGDPSDVAEAQSQATDMPMIPVDGMAEKTLVDGQQADSTSESNARMQQTEAGGTESTPVKTQDQILETVGAYIDKSAETGSEKTGAQMPQTLSAQAAAPPQEVQNPAAVKNAKGTAITDETQSGESLAANAKQTDTSDYAATDTLESTVAGKTVNDAMGNAQTTVEEKAEGIGEREPAVKVDTFDESGRSQNVTTPNMDVRETEPVAKDAAIQAAAQPETEEAAQYTKENVLRIVDKVSTQASEGRYDFDIELKPEFLGKVNIKLTMEDGVIRMQVKTDDMSVKGMLTDQTASLQNALKEKGLTLSSVDVTYESQASLDSGKQPFEQNDGQNRQGGMYYTHTEATGYEPAAEPYSYYVGNSSVEFLA